MIIYSFGFLLQKPFILRNVSGAVIIRFFVVMKNSLLSDYCNVMRNI